MSDWICPGGSVHVVTCAIAGTMHLFAPTAIAAPGSVTDPALEHLDRPGIERPPLPDYDVPDSTPEFILPPITPIAPEEQKLSSTIKVYVKEIRLTGNTIFTRAELSPILGQYENREIYNEELQALRQALTVYYVERGYINSGAVIPDQEVRDGVIEIQIVEGQLTEINVTGDAHLNSRYVSRRLELGAGPPLNINTLQQQLQILLQDPLIKKITSELIPGDRPGEAILTADVEEEPIYQAGIIADNHVSPSIGGGQLTAFGALPDITGYGDALSGQFAYAEGLYDVFLSYSVPVTPRDTSIKTYVQWSESDVVEEPFSIIDVESESLDYGISVSHPLFRTPNRSFTIRAELDRRHSKTFLLGMPFSFSPGVQDGVSDVTVVRLTQEWLDRRQNHVIAMNSTFNFGIDAFGATINKEAPDGRFFTWLGQFQFARRFSNDSQIIFRTDIQVAKDALLPLEKFAIGGDTSARGYRENQLVRDQGFVSSLEYRYPLFKDEFGQSQFHLAPFLDVGGAWEVGIAAPKPNVIVGTGFGLRWDPSQKLHAHVYWGIPLVDANNPENDLQDSGIHFQLSCQVF